MDIQPPVPLMPFRGAEIEYTYLEDVKVRSMLLDGMSRLDESLVVPVSLVMYQIRYDLGNANPYLLFYMVPVSDTEAGFPSFSYKKPFELHGDVMSKNLLMNKCFDTIHDLANSECLTHVNFVNGGFGRANHFRGLYESRCSKYPYLAFLDMDTIGFSCLTGGFSVSVDELLNLNSVGPNQLSVSDSLVNVFINCPQLTMLVEKTDRFSTIASRVSVIPSCVWAVSNEKSLSLKRKQDVLQLEDRGVGLGFHFTTDRARAACALRRYLILPLDPVYALPGETVLVGSEERAVYFYQDQRPVWKLPYRSGYVQL